MDYICDFLHHTISCSECPWGSCWDIGEDGCPLYDTKESAIKELESMVNKAERIINKLKENA